jgi:hypothetical protein
LQTGREKTAGSSFRKVTGHQELYALIGRPPSGVKAGKLDTAPSAFCVQLASSLRRLDKFRDALTNHDRRRIGVSVKQSGMAF